MDEGIGHVWLHGILLIRGTEEMPGLLTLTRSRTKHAQTHTHTHRHTRPGASFKTVRGRRNMERDQRIQPTNNKRRSAIVTNTRTQCAANTHKNRQNPMLFEPLK